MIFNLISKAKELFYSNKNSNLNARNVQDAIDELNNNLAQCCEWKYLGYKQGKAIFTLPENWHELCVYVSHNGNVGGTLIIPRVLTNSKQFFSQMDWKNTSQNVFTWFRVNITQTSISLYDSFVDGTSDVNTAYVWVLYR